MAKYLFIPVVGEIKFLELEEPIGFDTVRDIIGADGLEPVRMIWSDKIMFVDDCGKVKDPPAQMNIRASMLYPGTPYGDYIAGDVLIGKEDASRKQFIRHY